VGNGSCGQWWYESRTIKAGAERSENIPETESA
jgi:hypothetical protein